MFSADSGAIWADLSPLTSEPSNAEVLGSERSRQAVTRLVNKAHAASQQTRPGRARQLFGTLANTGWVASLLLVLFPLVASPAAATSFSLADLISNDAEFESADGGFEFGDFSAYLEGAPESDLSRFSIVPILHGFRVEAGPGQTLPGGAELILDYEVESEGPHSGSAPLMSMALEITGTSIVLGEMAAFGEGHGDHSKLGEVEVSISAGGEAYSAVDFTSPRDEIQVLAKLMVGYDSEVAGPEGGAAVMTFSVQPVPEPSTALLVVLGLGGLSIFRRSHHASS